MADHPWSCVRRRPGLDRSLPGGGLRQESLLEHDPHRISPGAYEVIGVALATAAIGVSLLAVIWIWGKRRRLWVAVWALSSGVAAVAAALILQRVNSFDAPSAEGPRLLLYVSVPVVIGGAAGVVMSVTARRKPREVASG